MTSTINAALAEIASGSGGLLQFYVVRHSDYPFIAGKAAEGDDESAIICGTLSAIAQGMSGSDQAANCLLCDRIITFRGSGAVALVGPNPFARGAKCVFRLLCAPCCGVDDADLMRSVTDRWRVVVTPTMRVLPPIHEAGHA